MLSRKAKDAITLGAVALLACTTIQIANQLLDSFNNGLTKGGDPLDALWRSSGSRMLSLAQENAFDPKTVAGKSFQEVDGLQEDGTYLLLHDEYQQGPSLSCVSLLEVKDEIKRVHYHFSSCFLFDDMFGNRLSYLYGIKMLAYAMRKPFSFTCGLKEGESPSGSAYFMKLNSLSDEPGPVPNRNGEEYTPEDVCIKFCRGTFCNWYFRNTDLASDAMIADWKYLASPSVVSITDYDDAVIHLRLGDGLYSTVGTNELKGLFPHATYIHLLKEAEKEKGAIGTIGIVTAPFKGQKVRRFDVGITSLSEKIANDLIRNLQGSFPNAKIRLHNSPDGTIIESLARLVNARKVAVCGASTFCPYALLATEGIGFVYKPLGRQNRWVRNAAKRYNNFRLYEAPMLNGLVIKNDRVKHTMPDHRVLRWLREQNGDVGNIDIT